MMRTPDSAIPMNAHDLYILAGHSPPHYVSGVVYPAYEPLTAAEAQAMIASMAYVYEADSYKKDKPPGRTYVGYTVDELRQGRAATVARNSYGDIFMRLRA